MSMRNTCGVWSNVPHFLHEDEGPKSEEEKRKKEMSTDSDWLWTGSGHCFFRLFRN